MRKNIVVLVMMALAAIIFCALPASASQHRDNRHHGRYYGRYYGGYGPGPGVIIVPVPQIGVIMPQYAPPPTPVEAPQQPQEPTSIELVVNQTQCRARVNGTLLEPGQQVRVDTDTSLVYVQSKSCAPEYKPLRPGVVGLVCAK